jgi:hypothetical protein
MPDREGRLVCEHLENIARDSLQDYPQIIRSFARGRHGVYALYRGSRLYYVGLATNLRRRLDQHLRDRLRSTWDRFSLYLTTDDRHLHEIEALFLRIGKPPGNRTRPRLTSKNLEPELRRRMTEKQRQQRDHILGRTGRGGGRGHAKKPLARTGRAGPAVLSPYVTERMKIRLSHGGRMHTASVHRDGTIHCEGRAFMSPSGAARAIVGVTVNGWRVWQYQRPRGDWVQLRALRGRRGGRRAVRS